MEKKIAHCSLAPLVSIIEHFGKVLSITKNNVIIAEEQKST